MNQSTQLEAGRKTSSLKIPYMHLLIFLSGFKNNISPRKALFSSTIWYTSNAKDVFGARIQPVIRGL
jgi:hypothetical protein